MTTTHAPDTRVRRRPTPAARLGFAISIAINGAMLWVAHQLLDWQWPAFLTDEFADVLPLVSASLVVSMAVNAVYLALDRRWVRPLGDLVTAVVAVVVTIRVLDVFPFDFSAYATDWTWLARTTLIVGLVGALIAALVNGVKLITDS